jgi:hypothetical protein
MASPYALHGAQAVGLPTGVIPGPVALPGTSARSRVPATTRPDPASIAQRLTQRLRGQGHTHVYTAALPGHAVVSLSQLTIWITADALTWTYKGQLTHWPVHDPGGAADRITQLTQPPTHDRPHDLDHASPRGRSCGPLSPENGTTPPAGAPRPMAGE